MGYNSQGSLQKHNKYHGYTYVRGAPNCPLNVLFVHLFCWGCPPIGMYMHSHLSGLLFSRTEKEYLRRISGIQLEFLILYIYVNIIHTFFLCTYIHYIIISINMSIQPKLVDCYIYWLIRTYKQKQPSPKKNTSRPKSLVAIFPRPDDKQVVGQGRGDHRPRTAQGVANQRQRVDWAMEMSKKW